MVKEWLNVIVYLTNPLFTVSFVASVLTTVVLVTKFVTQPAAHGSFAYSDTAAAALMSLGLLLDGIWGIWEAIQ